MDRLVASNSVPLAQADVAPTTGTPQYATDGNPATNTPATLWPAYAFNTFQDELMNVIVGAGITPDRTKWNQLLTAIQTMLQRSVTNVATDTGAANAYVVDFTPALSAPVPWAPFWIEVAHTNTGASTLNATGTVEPLVGAAHAALQGGEMAANGNALIYWNPTLASGSGSYVLLFCSGAPEQIAAATEPEHAVQLGQVQQLTSGVVGSMRNLTMSVAAASTSATFTADEIIVETALGGLRYCLANFNQTINLATTGAGGMDTGSAPASGFVAIYAIFNPTTKTATLIGQAEPSGGAPSIYGGAYMPPGYTASCLVSVWQTNASAQLVQGYQHDREIFLSTLTTVLSTNTQATVPTAFSVAAAVPKSARKCWGTLSGNAPAANTTTYIDVYSSSTGIAPRELAFGAPATNQLTITPFENQPLITPQTLYYVLNASSGSAYGTIYISGYSI